MFGNLELATLQQYWWIINSVVGSLFLFLLFVQGGQTLLLQVGKNDGEKALIVNSLGRKWELTFTTLVLFGGAMFAAFPKFYATSFGGAYWVWMLILFTFIVQAVSYEYRRKPANFLGASTYEVFQLINGTVGVLLIGAAVATFFSGSGFSLNEYNLVTWDNSLRGLEAAFSFFNLSLGLFLVFNSRVLGAMYLLNNIDFSKNYALREKLKKGVFTNFLISLPFLLYFLVSLLLLDGQQIGSNGFVTIEANKYFHNLLEMPLTAVLLLAGLVLVVTGVVNAAFKGSDKGIWAAGPGTFLVGLTVFFLAGLNNTPFYPSNTDLQSSLSIYNSSSSHTTLTAMSYVSLLVPFVLAYIVLVWRMMNRKKLTVEEATDAEAY